MDLSFFIARKYFFSGKKNNFINVISIISMMLVAVCTAALIVVLSVFNGLEDLLRSFYTSFDPEIKIEVKRGKSFEVDEALLTKIEEVEGVDIITEVIEDYAYVRYRESNTVLTIKGVSQNFLEQHRLDRNMVSGTLKLKEGNRNYAIIGQGVQSELSVMPKNDLYPLQIHYIKDVRPGQPDMRKLYSKKNLTIAGVFAIEANYDNNYIFVPLDFAIDLLDYGNKRTSLEIKTRQSRPVETIRNDLKEVLGELFRVQTNDEQHADLYKLLNLEKLFVFMAFSFILLIGSVNIFFALSMLVIEKKKDIAMLYSLGADKSLIRRIFLFEGIIISLGGAITGLMLGGIICWAQQHYGLVSMGMETSVLENYPVKMRIPDFIYSFLSLVVITFLISYRPAYLATKYTGSSYR